MFGNHLYHRLVKKYVAYFGTLFNNIEVRRYDKDSKIIGRLRVPISYASKDYYRQRLVSDPELARQAAQMLPRMGFMMSAMTYDVSRKINPLHNFVSNVGGTVRQMGNSIPYDFAFELHVWCKNQEDGQQIIEQIVPYFHPDFTASLKLVDFMDLSIDVPVVLDSVTNEDTYENSPDGTRTIIWTLQFTMKGHFFPEVKESPKGLVKHVDIHLAGDTDQTAGFQSNIEVKPSPTSATQFDPYTITTEQNFFNTAMHFNPVTCEPQLEPYEG